MRTLTWEFRWPLAILQLAAIMQHAIGLTSPLIMKRILVFQELNNKKDTLEGAVRSCGPPVGGCSWLYFELFVNAFFVHVVWIVFENVVIG